MSKVKCVVLELLVKNSHLLVVYAKQTSTAIPSEMNAEKVHAMKRFKVLTKWAAQKMNNVLETIVA